MNFYIDFEALQFSEQIINIGCLAENGKSFETYVKPPKGEKVNKFITDLTGITNEMLVGAPSADEAFSDLFDFIIENSDDTKPCYYCYGDSDKGFIAKTLKKMVNVKSITLATAMLHEMIDYSKQVKKYFNNQQNIALRKVYMFIKDEDITQKHNALEDAQMLQTVVLNLKNKCSVEDLEAITSIPSQAKPKNKAKAPEIFVAWTGNREEADTRANETNWNVKCYTKNGGEVKYFPDWEVAALWTIRYLTKNLSPKKEQHIKKVIQTIKSAMNVGNRAYGFWWEEKGE